MKLNELVSLMRPSAYVKVNAGYGDNEPREIWCGPVRNNPFKDRKPANNAMVTKVDFVPRLIGDVDSGVFAAGYMLITLKLHVRQDMKELARIGKEALKDAD